MLGHFPIPIVIFWLPTFPNKYLNFWIWFIFSSDHCVGNFITLWSQFQGRNYLKIAWSPFLVQPTVMSRWYSRTVMLWQQLLLSSFFTFWMDQDFFNDDPSCVCYWIMCAGRVCQIQSPAYCVKRRVDSPAPAHCYHTAPLDNCFLRASWTSYTRPGLYPGHFNQSWGASGNCANVVFINFKKPQPCVALEGMLVLHY